MAKTAGSRARRKPAADTKREKTSAAVPGSTIPIMGIMTWTDPLQKPTPFVLDVEFDPRDGTALLRLDLRLRSVASIELRPVRRPLHDSAGHVADAERLANVPM